ncbi:MAG: GvpL/GvpF family gas vesicle protein [Deltaproteobacteria bacterium]|nr:GvpL/GvpF family gas vesicle protein [Deltaproteobacteria bacterium]
MAETPRILQGQAQQPAVGWYVYAFIAHRHVPPLAGIDEAFPLTLIVEQGIGALVSQVPLPEFGGEALSRNLKDLRWLEAKVRRHSGIVVEAAAGGPVLPMQFGTIFLDRARIVAVIRRNVATLQAALDHLQGKEEWGVTGMFQPTALRARLLRTDPALLTLSKRLCSASTGHAYLLEKCLEELSSVKVRARETRRLCSPGPLGTRRFSSPSPVS